MIARKSRRCLQRKSPAPSGAALCPLGAALLSPTKGHGVSSGSLALLKQSADGVPPAEQATTRQYHTNAVASGSTLRLCQWQLVRQLRPLAFHDRPHLIGDHRDVLNLEHVFVQPPQVRRLAIDDARRVGRLIPSSRTGGTPGLER